jgi:hypothetical protein
MTFLLRQTIFIKDIDPDTCDDSVNMGSLFGQSDHDKRSASPVAIANYNIPNMLTSIDNWPRSTKQHCHYCGIDIDGVPAPTAIAHDSRSGVFMLAKYVYCSFEHRINELEELNLVTSVRSDLIKLTRKIAKLFGINSVEKGALKDDRTAYGGRYTDVEYKRRIHHLSLA